MISVSTIRFVPEIRTECIREVMAGIQGGNQSDPGRIRDDHSPSSSDTTEGNAETAGMRTEPSIFAFPINPQKPGTSQCSRRFCHKCAKAERERSMKSLYRRAAGRSHNDAYHLGFERSNPGSDGFPPDTKRNKLEFESSLRQGAMPASSSGGLPFSLASNVNS
jgi:hypothetical protein